MFGLFRRKRIPPRHRSAAYMNLAFGKIPTATDEDAAAWDAIPTPLTNLTDGNEMTHFTGHGLDNDAKSTWIEIDLGQEFEVYEINVKSLEADGFKQEAAATIPLVVSLITGAEGETPATGTTRDTQIVPHDNTYVRADLHYVGAGIPVRYVWIEFTPESGRTVTVDLSEVEVFGC